MAQLNAVIETATGHILRVGYCDFTIDGSFNSGSETQLVNIDKNYDYNLLNEIDMDTGLVNATVTKWNGSTYEEVAQP